MLPSLLASSTFILLITYVSIVAGDIGPRAELDISNRVISPDGYSRSALIANGIFPGPVLQGIKGNTFSINVANFANDPSQALTFAVHWHGILQTNTNDADGIPGVTQCPIVPNEAFIYQFNAGDQTGTFLYRAYTLKDTIDSVAGAMVIYDPEDPQGSLYDVDNESTIVTLSDYYHSEPKPLRDSYLSGATKGNVPTPGGGLINGKGRYLKGPSVDLSVINVKASVRYRLRLVNLGTATAFHFSIDGHKLTVIEVDGTSVKPHVVDRIRIDVGQRYSVVINADQPIGNYQMRAVMDTTCFSDANTVEPLVTAILRYGGAPAGDPTTLPLDQYVDLNQADLRPLQQVAVPGQPTPGGAETNIAMDMAYDMAAFNWTVNGVSWRPAAVPTLLRVLNGETKFPPGVFSLGIDKSIEITINNNHPCPQPFHLHGHRFHVVSDDGSKYNFDNPIIRDTVTVAANGKAVIRFVADNPGAWALHSQNEWYRQAGLLAEVLVSPGEIATNVHPPSEWDSLCPNYNNFVGAT